MKTWMNPEIEVLDVRLTATVHGDGTGKGDGKHCETHWSNGHNGECGPGCDQYTGGENSSRCTVTAIFGDEA